MSAARLIAGLSGLARRRGAARATRTAERLATLINAIPGVLAETTGEGVMVRGRDLRRRRLRDARLRWLAGLLR